MPDCYGYIPAPPPAAIIYNGYHGCNQPLVNVNPLPVCNVHQIPGTNHHPNIYNNYSGGIQYQQPQQTQQSHYNNYYYPNQPQMPLQPQQQQQHQSQHHQNYRQYDCVDGLPPPPPQMYTTCGDEYNQAGNRYPLPIQYDIPPCSSNMHYNRTPSISYPLGYSNCNIPKTVSDFNTYDNSQPMYYGGGGGGGVYSGGVSNGIKNDYPELSSSCGRGGGRDDVDVRNLIDLKSYENKKYSNENFLRKEQQEHQQQIYNKYNQQQQSVNHHHLDIDEQQQPHYSTTTMAAATSTKKKALNKNHKMNGKIITIDNYEIDTEKSSSRNSDFDSYEETEEFRRGDEKLINKNHDGIGSAQKWTKILIDSEKNKPSNSENNYYSSRDTIQGLDLDASFKQKCKKLESNNKTNDIISSSNSVNAPSTQSKHNGGTTTINNKSRNSNNSMATQMPVVSSTTNSGSGVTTKKRLDERKPIKQTISRAHDEYNMIKTQSTNQWNCKHCTYINSESRGICEMCSKSKDFNDSSGSKNQSKSKTQQKCS